jgi:hypothetical protein
VVTCPYCNQRTVSRWRKLLLAAGGPSIACMSCGKRVGVSWWSFIAFLPFALSFSGIGRIPLPWVIAWMVGGVAFYILAHMFIVPMVGRDT